MARHSTRWRPTGAALAFLLAAVAGVAGNQLTGHLTVALGIFVLLLAAGMAVTFLIERHADEHPPYEDQGVGGVKPNGVYDLRGARGVQVGDSNRQTNYFGPKPDHRE